MPDAAGVGWPRLGVRARGLHEIEVWTKGATHTGDEQAGEVRYRIRWYGQSIGYAPFVFAGRKGWWARTDGGAPALASPPLWIAAALFAAAPVA